GESRPGVARSARPGGWGQHHYFEERSDEAALRSERISACSRDFKPFGVLERLSNDGYSDAASRLKHPRIKVA
ncbi:MAG TPA: hypothetical protein VKP30_00675, partial [Polyangiaceae bacterium]|nr:hypothetical protein [Polyangiaceae bacterium]